MKIALVQFSILILIIVSLKETSGKHHKKNENRAVECPQIKCAKLEPDPNNPPCQRCAKDVAVVGRPIDDLILCAAIACPLAAVARNKIGCPICPREPVMCLAVEVICNDCERKVYNPCQSCEPIEGCEIKEPIRPDCKLVACSLDSLQSIDPVTGCRRCIPRPIKPKICPLVNCLTSDTVIDSVTGCLKCRSLRE